MDLHCGHGDAQFMGDLCVRQAAGHVYDYLVFPRREVELPCTHPLRTFPPVA